MRLFVEVSIDHAALDQAAAVAGQLRDLPESPAGCVRWVRRDALHLTLRFLGEVEPSRLDDVSAALTELRGAGAAQLRFTHLGAFGGRHPRVIWLGLERDEGFQRLIAMRDRLDGALERVGFERAAGAYRPHLTLGRVRRQATARQQSLLRQCLERAERVGITARMERAALVESTLTPQGPRYRRRSLVEL